jgi:predicted PurR-regulated permease PerM
MMDQLRPSGRDRRLLSAILVLGVVVLFFMAVGSIASAIYYFGDILLAFFLAWLLAFIISPLVTRIVDAIPRLPRALATVIIYTLIVIVLVILALVVAQALANSITQFLEALPEIRSDIASIVAPLQAWLDGIGLSQVHLSEQVLAVLNNVDQLAAGLVAPLQSVAVASIGAVGTGLIIFFLSIYMVVDRDQILAFLYRLVPPNRTEEAQVLQTAIARSFGGFLRGQSVMAIVYFAWTLGVNVILGLPLAALTSVTSGLLQGIPFFGPFVSWTPPVIVAVLLQPQSVVPALILMLIGWFVVMNVLQPRIMQGAVGIHPIVVLASVLIGSRVAGVAGAIFGIPIAAVLSSIFFNVLKRTSSERSVTDRAAKVVSEREGRPVRPPREPLPGQAVDVEAD